LAQRDFPKVSKSSAWRGKAISWHHVWDCGANESRHYEELYFQIGLAVEGHRIAGGFSCETTNTLRTPTGGASTTDSGRSAVITRGEVINFHYSFHVVFCDDYTQSCDLRGRSLGDILLAGTYDCSRAGKQVDSGIWTVEPLSNGQPNCPDLYGTSNFKRDEKLQGVVESTGEPARPIRGAGITVMCRGNGKVLARVETDANGRYAVPGMQLGVRYACILDPRIPGYRKGEITCIPRAFLDWQLAKGLNPVATPCSPGLWPEQCYGPQAPRYHAFDPKPDDVEISGGVAYETKSLPFKYASGATIEVCSASNKLLGTGRTDAQGYYEVYVPINRGPYSCRLQPSEADSSAGYLGGIASCHANGWLLRVGQTPSATDAPGCDYVGPCPGRPIFPVEVLPPAGKCLP
jgi:hypothetical protein